MMKKYNIEMTYPPQGASTDTTLLFQMLKDLDIELLGVQEMVDPELFGAMAKRHLGNNYSFIYAPSNAWQKIGFLYDASVLQLIGDPVIYWEVSLEEPDRHRPALAAYFKTIPDGFDFYAVVVHLKASPRGYEERKKQWTHLEDIIRQLPSGEKKDQDIILLGDFNNVSSDRFEEFLPLINRSDFIWLGSQDTTFVTAYWHPDWNKPELKRSVVDQICISSDATEEYIETSLKVGAICAEGKSSISGEFPDYYRKISDHCPVFISFRPYPDND